MVEPVVRIRCPTPEDAARARAGLSAAGHAPEEAPGGLAVRDADPDAVNALLVGAGALGRTVAREQVGKLVGYLIDRRGDFAGRGPALEQIVRRALAETGLADRYAARPAAALVPEAERLHEELMDSAGGFVSWERFVGACCLARAG
jgi:hypothetical protein